MGALSKISLGFIQAINWDMSETHRGQESTRPKKRTPRKAENPAYLPPTSTNKEELVHFHVGRCFFMQLSAEAQSASIVHILHQTQQLGLLLGRSCKEIVSGAFPGAVAWRILRPSILITWSTSGKDHATRRAFRVMVNMIHPRTRISLRD